MIGFGFFCVLMVMALVAGAASAVRTHRQASVLPPATPDTVRHDGGGSGDA